MDIGLADEYTTPEDDIPTVLHLMAWFRAGAKAGNAARGRSSADNVRDEQNLRELELATEPEDASS